MPFLPDAEIVINALNEYFRESAAAGKPVIRQAPIGDLIRDLGLAASVETGGLTDGRLSAFLDTYLASTTRLHHPAYLAHQVAVPHYAGALGALIDGFTNNPMAIYEMGPAAAAIEYFIINWMLEKVGWVPSPVGAQKDEQKDFGAGVLTHGGSLANLTAMLAARNRIAPEAWEKGNPRDLVLLAPAGCHYSISRCAGILGIGLAAMYHLDVDERGAVIPDRLPAMYARIRNEGKWPMALVANACSTAVGIYDPLQEIGAFCREKGIWFHVDGAHGASALLSEKYRHLLQGVELADSLTWDAHKLMRVPGLCAALLVRDHRSIDGVFEQEASYLFHEKEQPGFDFIHRTVECTKAGLGLKLFLVLAALGERGLAQYIERQITLTREAFDYVNRLPGFQCAVEPECNILCFRVEGSDRLQLDIRDTLIAEGSFYLSTTVFNGRRYLRLSVMNPDTGMDTIRKLTARIGEL
jgi:L-2,4-diaminobutyrate decarboxylase